MRHRLGAFLLSAALFLAGTLLAGCAGAPPAEPRAGAVAAPPVTRTPERRSMDPLAAVDSNPRAFAFVVISVADMDQALGLWVERFGMRVAVRREGRDPVLARAWGLGETDILDQALLVTPGQRVGGVHLVRFRLPGPAVREDATPTDRLPKSVDIAVRDIQQRYAELAAAGYRFRSPVGTLQAETGPVHEVHMAAHDALNLVFVEMPDRPEPVSEKGYGVAPQIVVITGDNERESAFLADLLGLEKLAHNRFSGPSVEKTIGLPAGAALDVRILGDAGSDFGRLELVQYERAPGRDLYPRAVPPARGMLSVTYVLPSLAELRTRAAARAVTLVERGRGNSVFGNVEMAGVTTPAGLRIDFVAR